MENVFRWGVIGTGAIAAKFADAVSVIEDAEIVAVANRTLEKAQQFAERFGIETVYDDNAKLLADESIDAVYVATLNTTHFEVVKQALEAGKPVHCEKPLVMSSAEAEELVALAREKNVFLGENLWTRYLPVYQRIRELIAEDGIGEIRVIHADYFFRIEFSETSRFFDRSVGGGTILDTGIYGLGFIGMFLGYKPDRVYAVGRLGKTGVDEVLHISLGYPNGAMADSTHSLSTPAPFRAMVIGTRGRLEINEYGRAQSATVYQYPDVEVDVNSKGPGTVMNVPEGTTSYVIDEPFEKNGFEYIIRAVMEAVRSGKTELEYLTWDEILSWIKIKDDILAEVWD